MKEDFLRIKDELNDIGIRKISCDFYMEPRKKGAYYFVKSPHSKDKTASLCLYPNNRFCDFANSNQSGDSIAFLAYIRKCSQWESLQTLRDYYGLTDSRKQSKQEIRRRILVQQEQERKKRQRQQAFKTALFACIDDLKRWEDIYKAVLKIRLYEPLSDMWCYIMNELQRTERKLDILCGSNQSEYRFMKTGSESIPSDRFQWLLDSLEMLRECGAFQATQGELAEIRAQRDFELIKEPRAERRCGIEW